MSNHKIIHVNNAPEAIGPYSQAIIVNCNELIFTSGQIGIDPVTNNLVEGIENQTHQVFKNLIYILREARSGLENVVKATILLKDINNFELVNKIYESYFGGYKPARSCVEVSNLPKKALIEIEVVAYR